MISEFIGNEGEGTSIALVTTLPVAVTALTGVRVNTLNRRTITKIRLTDAQVGVALSAGTHVVDLYYLPAVSGEYSLASSANAQELAVRLSSYTLAVDLSSFTALHRRGETPDDEVATFLADHPGANGDTARGYLEYRNFLDVLDGLVGAYRNLRGTVLRPRQVTWVSNKLDRDNEDDLVIRDFTYTEDFITLDDPMWARLKGMDGGYSLLGTAAGQIDEVDSLQEMLKAKGMDTLLTSVMASSYAGDVWGMVRGIVGAKDPRFLQDLNEILKRRSGKYTNGREDAAFADVADRIAALETRLRDALNAEGPQINLVDQYHISGGPEGKWTDDNQESKTRKFKFRAHFPYLFAFIKLWDELEESFDTQEMNDTANGWYMSASTIPMLRAASKMGLKTPITAWAVPLIVTNSVGFFPNPDEHAAEFAAAIRLQLAQLIITPAYA